MTLAVSAAILAIQPAGCAIVTGMIIFDLSYLFGVVVS